MTVENSFPIGCHDKEYAVGKARGRQLPITQLTTKLSAVSLEAVRETIEQFAGPMQTEWRLDLVLIAGHDEDNT